jgi:hypothetical protein
MPSTLKGILFEATTDKSLRNSRLKITRKEGHGHVGQ